MNAIRPTLVWLRACFVRRGRTRSTTVTRRHGRPSTTVREYNNFESLSPCWRRVNPSLQAGCSTTPLQDERIPAYPTSSTRASLWHGEMYEQRTTCVPVDEEARHAVDKPRCLSITTGQTEGRRDGPRPGPSPGLTGQTPAVQGMPRFELASLVKEPAGEGLPPP